MITQEEKGDQVLLVTLEAVNGGLVNGYDIVPESSIRYEKYHTFSN